MKVVLLQGTSDPLRLAYAQTRGTTTSKGFDEVWNEPQLFFPKLKRQELFVLLDGPEPDIGYEQAEINFCKREMTRLVTEALQANHWSVARGIKFTFAFEVSRSTGRQMLRHVVDVNWEEMSLRYVKISGAERPKSWDNPNKADPRHRFTDGQEQEMQDRYLEGDTSNDLADRFGANPKTIQQILNRRGVPMRLKGVKRAISSDFFEALDADKAWLLGWIMSDGEVKQDHIIVSQRTSDRYILEQIKRLVGTKADKAVSDTRYGKYPLSKVEFYLEDAISKLAAYGVNTSKSTYADARMLNHIPEHLRRDFIRGVFEGDGWIEKNLKNLGICGTPELMAWITDNAPVAPSSSYADERCENHGGLFWSGEAGREMAEWLYQDFNPLLCLDRKVELACSMSTGLTRQVRVSIEAAYDAIYQESPVGEKNIGKLLMMLRESDRSVDAYRNAVRDGVNPEDARDLLPLGTKTQMIATMGFEAVHNLMGKRLCTRAQEPIREITKAMRKAIVAEHPWLGRFMVPHCLPMAICPETHPDGCPLLAENGGNVLRQKQAQELIRAHVKSLKELSHA